MHPSLLTKPRANQPLTGGHVHIDMLKMSGPLEHYPTGDVIYRAAADSDSVDAVGVRPTKPKRGSHKKNDEIYHRSCDLHGDQLACAIEFRCCPPKALQGHNLFGHADIRAYAYAIFCQQTRRLGIQVRPEDRKDWASGLFGLTEVHLTANFRCPPIQRNLIEAIAQNEVLHARDRLTSITLGSTPNGRSVYHTVTVYSKYEELPSQWTKPDATQRRLMELAKDSIRVEVKLHAQGLRTRDLHFGARWGDVDVDALFFEILAKYNVVASIQPMLTEDEKAMLPPRLRKTYVLWLNGEDPRTLLGKTSFSTHRREIKTLTGIDIGGARRPEALSQVHSADIFSRENILAVPDWLYDTKHFRDPPLARGLM